MSNRLDLEKIKRVHAGATGADATVRELIAEVERLRAENAEHRRTIRAYVEATQGPS